MSTPPKDNKGPKSYAQAASPENPPPPYTAGQGSSSHPQQQQQQQQHHQPQVYQYQQQRTNGQRQALLGAPAGVVVVIPHHQIAVARAKRRFFGAIFWALIIYLVAGVLFGDYELDQSRRNRHRSPRHPDWNDFDSKLAPASVPVADAASVVPIPVNDDAPFAIVPEFV